MPRSPPDRCRKQDFGPSASSPLLPPFSFREFPQLRAPHPQRLSPQEGEGELRGTGFGNHAVSGSSSFGLGSAKAKEVAGPEQFTEHGSVARDAHFLVQRER